MKKATNVLNVLEMESDSLASADQRCSQVFGIVADQGTEKGLADIDKLRPPEHGPVSNREKGWRAFPNAMWMPEHSALVQQRARARNDHVDDMKVLHSQIKVGRYMFAGRVIAEIVSGHVPRRDGMCNLVRSL